MCCEWHHTTPGRYVDRLDELHANMRGDDPVDLLDGAWVDIHGIAGRSFSDLLPPGLRASATSPGRSTSKAAMADAHATLCVVTLGFDNRLEAESLEIAHRGDFLTHGVVARQSTRCLTRHGRQDHRRSLQVRISPCATKSPLDSRESRFGSKPPRTPSGRVAPLVRVLRRARGGGAAAESRHGRRRKRAKASGCGAGRRRIPDGAAERKRRRVRRVGQHARAPRAARHVGITAAEVAQANAARLAGLPQLSAQLHAHQRRRGRSRRRAEMAVDGADVGRAVQRRRRARFETQLQESTIYRAAFSQRQLYQRMVEFWTRPLQPGHRQGRLSAASPTSAT